MANMDLSNLSNRVIVVQSIIPSEDEEYPSFTADIWGHSHTYWFCINRGDPRECNVIFLNLDTFQKS